MSKGKVLEFLSRPEMAMSKLKKVLQKEIESEDRARSFYGASDPFVANKTQSGKEILMELNPYNFDGKSSGKMKWMAQYGDSPVTGGGFIEPHGFGVSAETWRKANRMDEADQYDFLKALDDLNKRDQVFFADGSTL